MRKIDIPKDLLIDLYTNKKLTLKEIADDFGVSRQTISNKLKEYDIPIRNSDYIKVKKSKKCKLVKIKKNPEYWDKDTFQKIYSKVKAIDLVAKYFNISFDTAYLWKQRHNIETIKGVSVEGRNKININKPYADEETLRDMYSQYSTEALGEMWNCHPSTLLYWMRKFNIPVRTSAEQWELKSKKGNMIVKSETFDLQLYKTTYSTSEKLPTRITKFIKELVGKCQACDYTEVLDLHHINENSKDNRPENHVILCPNCHAKIHRLLATVKELVPQYESWDKLLDNYQEAK